MNFSSAEWLYAAEQTANAWVADQLTHLSPVSAGIILAAGLLTSLSPCVLGMLPVTLAYIGGYGETNRKGVTLQVAWFALGLATTLALLGLGATLLGRLYGQWGWGLPVAVSLVAILMGLSLLEVIPLTPSWGPGVAWVKAWPAGLQAYGVGLTFGLSASPCSTPVLATLLTWVGSTGRPGMGLGLLLLYAVGYTFPVVLAGFFAATLKGLLALRPLSRWLTPLSGALLLGFGVFSLMDQVF
ncbi:MAG: cytochrome c biogenesis protein CcdA [Gloeomargaritaceae cyanobacterium C42_A2020_066]|nr:cytochrome c biogenesis protein CcdA [Gloeomargaritaceae cyanobacterium C42_A2020_066]